MPTSPSLIRRNSNSRPAMTHHCCATTRSSQSSRRRMATIGSSSARRLTKELTIANTGCTSAASPAPPPCFRLGENRVKPLSLSLSAIRPGRSNRRSRCRPLPVIASRFFPSATDYPHHRRTGSPSRRSNLSERALPITTPVPPRRCRRFPAPCMASSTAMPTRIGSSSRPRRIRISSSGCWLAAIARRWTRCFRSIKWMASNSPKMTTKAHPIASSTGPAPATATTPFSFTISSTALAPISATGSRSLTNLHPSPPTCRSSSG